MNKFKEYIFTAFFMTVFTIYMLKDVSPFIFNKLMLWTANERLANSLALVLPTIFVISVFVVLKLFSKFCKKYS